METPKQGLSKVEGLIMPVTAGYTFFRDDLPYIFAGDFNGVIEYEVGLLKTWHPPTLLGLSNMIKDGLGAGAFTALGGWAIEEVGKVMGSGLVEELGDDFKKVGHGMIIGTVADGLARPAKYNPGTGSGGGGAEGIGGKPGRKQGSSDHVMWNQGDLYERTSKAAHQPAAILPA